ncbi:hypothetical protein [Streptomyces sp. DSS69]|uniref:hypothetical protein n=1 Tax=Streptomyces sp. DSS69 TaxID=3113369 RepID=UPI0031F99E49
MLVPAHAQGGGVWASLDDCSLPVAPTAEEIAYLLTSVDEKPLLLAEWSESSVGAVLAGTAMVVTDATSRDRIAKEGVMLTWWGLGMARHTC